MNIKEGSLRKVLVNSHNMELPRQLMPNEERFWIEAIVLVKKQNCTQSYAIARHRGNGSIDYLADYGTISPIAGIVSIHPYLYLDESFIPSQKGAKLRATLKRFYRDDERKVKKIDNATDEDLEFMKIDYAIVQQANGATRQDIMETIDNEINEKIKQSKEEDEDEDDAPILASAKPTK